MDGWPWSYIFLEENAALWLNVTSELDENLIGEDWQRPRVAEPTSAASQAFWRGLPDGDAVSGSSVLQVYADLHSAIFMAH